MSEALAVHIVFFIDSLGFNVFTIGQHKRHLELPKQQFCLPSCGFTLNNSEAVE